MAAQGGERQVARAGVVGIALALLDAVAGIVESLTSWLVTHTYVVVFLATLIDATAFPFPGPAT